MVFVTVHRSAYKISVSITNGGQAGEAFPVTTYDNWSRTGQETIKIIWDVPSIEESHMSHLPEEIRSKMMKDYLLQEGLVAKEKSFTVQKDDHVSIYKDCYLVAHNVTHGTSV